MKRDSKIGVVVRGGLEAWWSVWEAALKTLAALLINVYIPAVWEGTQLFSN